MIVCSTARALVSCITLSRRSEVLPKWTCCWPRDSFGILATGLSQRACEHVTRSEDFIAKLDKEPGTLRASATLCKRGRPQQNLEDTSMRG